MAAIKHAAPKGPRKVIHKMAKRRNGTPAPAAPVQAKPEPQEEPAKSAGSPQPGILVQITDGRISGFIFTEDVVDPPGWGPLMAKANGQTYRRYSLHLPGTDETAQHVLSALIPNVRNAIVLAAFQAGRQSVLDEEEAALTQNVTRSVQPPSEEKKGR